MISGQWSREESQYSINQLELLAVLRTFQQAPLSWHGKKVLLSTDNSTAVAYVNKMGGTRSRALSDVTWEIFTLL